MPEANDDVAALRAAHAAEMANLTAKHEKELVFWERDKKRLLHALQYADTQSLAMRADAVTRKELVRCVLSLRNARVLCKQLAAEAAEAKDRAGMPHNTLCMHAAMMRAHGASPPTTAPPSPPTPRPPPPAPAPAPPAPAPPAHLEAVQRGK